MPTDLEFWLKVITETLILTTLLVGLFGLVVPIFPGLTVIWIGALAYGLIAGFGVKGWIIFSILTVLMLVGNVVDNFLMGAKARDGGASWISIAFGLAAGIIGSILFPPLGGLISAPLILFLAEYIRQKDHFKAFQTVKSLLIGWGWSVLVRFIIGLVMVALWMIWAWT
ncbi:MAG: DUF456 domain-containing protein [Anaerolineales bacterium]|nr:DUF456 domain-containing protein [Anaerolineales bacterium]